ncbi:BnaCnng25250D [Brassica napus]|uniref:BnaCnng25250D protein n=1 Tax=Brassica napus TaxID=3708 RepID=A0A078IWZ7_BRANA|nr:BnaCnng25250D [Brassica napus]
MRCSDGDFGCSSVVEARLLRFWEARNVKRGGELMWADLLFMEVNGTIIFVEINHVCFPSPAWLCEVEAEEEKKEGKKKTRKRKMKMNWCMERVIWRMRTITDDENDYEDDADDEEDDGQNVTPLLNPDENIAQWKAVKAKPVRRVKQLMKENVEPDSDDQAKPLMKEIIVNTSLADWLASPKTFHGNGLCKRSQLVISPTWKTGQKFHTDSPL